MTEICLHIVARMSKSTGVTAVGKQTMRLEAERMIPMKELIPVDFKEKPQAPLGLSCPAALATRSNSIIGHARNNM